VAVPAAESESDSHAGIAQLIGESAVDQGARYDHATHA
jgi:hypothetical protein